MSDKLGKAAKDALLTWKNDLRSIREQSKEENKLWRKSLSTVLFTIGMSVTSLAIYAWTDGLSNPRGLTGFSFLMTIGLDLTLFVPIYAVSALLSGFLEGLVDGFKGQNASLNTNYADITKELLSEGSDIELDDPYSASNAYMVLNWFPDWVLGIDHIKRLDDLLQSGVEELSGETVGLFTVLVDALCAFPQDEPDIEERNRLMMELNPLLSRLIADVSKDVKAYEKEKASGIVKERGVESDESNAEQVRNILDSWMPSDDESENIEDIRTLRAQLDDIVSSQYGEEKGIAESKGANVPTV